MNIKNMLPFCPFGPTCFFSLKTCCRGSTFQKSGETTKRMDRLAPNLVHICGLIWESTYVGKHFAPRDPRWAFGICWGQKYKSLGNLPNGWTNWHHIWYMSANSSGNGHRLKRLAPQYPRRAFFGFYGVKYQKVGENGQTAGPIETKLCTIY